MIQKQCYSCKQIFLFDEQSPVKLRSILKNSVKKHNNRSLYEPLDKDDEVYIRFSCPQCNCSNGVWIKYSKLNFIV